MKDNNNQAALYINDVQFGTFGLSCKFDKTGRVMFYVDSNRVAKNTAEKTYEERKNAAIKSTVEYQVADALSEIKYFNKKNREYESHFFAVLTWYDNNRRICDEDRSRIDYCVKNFVKNTVSIENNLADVLKLVAEYPQVVATIWDAEKSAFETDYRFTRAYGEDICTAIENAFTAETILDDGSNDDDEEDFLASLDTSIDEDTETDELVDEAEPLMFEVGKVYYHIWFDEDKNLKRAYFKFIKRTAKRLIFEDAAGEVVSRSSFVSNFDGSCSECVLGIGRTRFSLGHSVKAHFVGTEEDFAAEKIETKIWQFNEALADYAVTPEALEVATQAEIDNARAEHFKQVKINSCLWWINKTTELVAEARKQIEAKNLFSAEFDAHSGFRINLSDYARAILGNFDKIIVPQARFDSEYLKDKDLCFTNEDITAKMDYDSGEFELRGYNDNGYVVLARYDNFRQFDAALKLFKYRFDNNTSPYGLYVDSPEVDEVIDFYERGNQRPPVEEVQDASIDERGNVPVVSFKVGEHYAVKDALGKFIGFIYVLKRYTEYGETFLTVRDYHGDVVTGNIDFIVGDKDEWLFGLEELVSARNITEIMPDVKAIVANFFLQKEVV